jgi:hypothetical protein
MGQQKDFGTLRNLNPEFHREVGRFKCLSAARWRLYQ